MAIVPHSAGIALALFAGINSDRLTLIDQFVLGPQEEVNCSFTSIAKSPSDDGRVVSCVRFTPLARFEVDLWLFEVHIDFEALNQSSLSLLNDNIDTPYQSYSTGLAPILFYELFTDSQVIWFDDEVLFTVLHGSSFSLAADHFYADTSGSVCSGNNVADVRQSRDLNNLLVYCSENNLINISVRDRGEMTVDFKQTQTRFYCRPEGIYIEQRNKTLALVSPGLLDHVIPHPLNLSERYVGDCAMTEDAAYFIGTSRDGSIALTNLLNNQTIILADNAQINHQLIDGHVLLFSNSTVSVVQDLACHSQQFSSNQTYLLATFELNPDFSCPDQPVTTPAETTAATSHDKPTNELTRTLGLSIGILVVLAAIFIVIVVSLRLVKARKK